MSFIASLLLLITAVAAIAGFTALLLKHWRIAVSLLVGAAALALLLGNLRDLRRG